MELAWLMFINILDVKKPSCHGRFTSDMKSNYFLKSPNTYKRAQEKDSIRLKHFNTKKRSIIQLFAST
ncbi:hypothetical protein SAMN05444380_107123 [Thermophagus xiamenensis]|uniref:Uncharacterized protein n=1 Tax=Thermophagus xiamenensis TaxID=385682 RepID=A0A1I1Y9G5_9BACT|nr:hypothetical protein SAMN05444380_107123 [Thermophagus xiamenensis]